jgi:threonyl-tRNA synthetase
MAPSLHTLKATFTDLCKGPHLVSTGAIKAIKITSVAGAFWRGDAKREQMTRIYGITFPKKKMLDEYLVMLEEAKKRDHRKIGKEMELFMFSDRVGKGLPIWLPKGTELRSAFAGYASQNTEELQLSGGHHSGYRFEESVRHFRSLCSLWQRIPSSRSILLRRMRSIC